MAHKKSLFIEALDRSEARRDGGFKQSWSFSFSDDSEEERRNDTSLVTMDQVGGWQELSPEGMKQAPPLRHFGPMEPVKTYERRPNHFKSLNRMGTGKPSEAPHPMAISPLPNRTNYLIVSPAPSQGVVVQGRLFQHTHLPSPVRKPVQSNLDLKERPDFTTQPIQRVELDNIILTCPEISDSENLNIKRCVQQKRRSMFEGMGTVPSSGTAVEPLQPDEYFTVCGNCGQQSEDHIKCDNCGNSLPAENHLLPTVPSSPAPRPPIRSQNSPGPTNMQLSKNFYGPASGARSPQVDIVMNPPARITRGSLLLPHNGRPSATSAGNSGSYVAKLTKGKRQPLAKQHELNDPIVLSSDEDEEADNASTGSVSRLDSVSPRPADSAHSSPAPSGGRVEAAVKGVVEHEEHACEFFTDMDHRNMAPRRNRMKDPFGNALCEDPSPSKKRKVGQPQKLESIILDCRSVRIGSLRRMVTKPVIFTVEYIQLETESQEVDVLEKVRLRSSELTKCEWCSVRKLPVLFFQTSDSECQRLRTQLQMTQESGGLWYDCNGSNVDEKYIVLIFENGLSMQEQMILEDILVEIGRNNNLSGFPARLPFDEANIRLVQYNKASKEKEKAKAQKAKTVLPSTTTSTTAATTVTASVTTATATVTAVTANAVTPTPTASTETAVRTRMSAQLHAFYDEDEDEDMAELHPTFTGPVIKLMMYPPPPAKGGISVTNEDLHCLNDGEFLNDVIIDFYLKYLFIEKLKKEDAHKSHVFSSFFYKRLNQRERRNAQDTTNLPIQKRKHNRVKTWTRHVDLFQKDFIFVPINESAHWYLAVICFPGLERVQVEPNPLYQAQPPSQPRGNAPPSAQLGSSVMRDGGLEEPSPHTEPISFNQFEVNAEEALCEQPASMPPCAHKPEHSCAHGMNGQVKVQPHYTDALHRISVCYSTDDTGTFSDDQSSCHDECSEDGTLADDTGASESMEWTSRPTICKQPCILIMDSLRGPARSTVVKTLREYLEVEWEVKKGSRRSFGKDVMKGSSPRVPQQDNFSDCGVYVLQYVESFFENPIPSFHLPMTLLDWFPQQRMKTKRDEIKELILKIQSEQQSDRENSGQAEPCDSPCEDLDVGDALESADLIPPISS
ncbi:sentrin-specific protease 6 isoform X1 [Colossoma macropomum]|uniref:sentrin-specific protease 6 isoform X1 n=3 Tax=Colossoma macropomum TaxID=42526 RepID=UPI0018652C72|nr:sentrin-specific protease 6 isoform X1 [Colossoma macropomum]XP_036438247.1 sentrin-specific protease 6 isoform X1 [Colossoma macropomum]